MLTVRQADALRFIAGYIQAKGGIGPSHAAVAKGLGTSSNESVHRILLCLEERGFIRRVPYRHRAIEVVRPIAIPTLNGEPLFAVPFHHAQPISTGLDK